MSQLTHRQPQPDERLPIDHDSNVDVNVETGQHMESHDKTRVRINCF